ncbi:hypothetical protein KKC59_04170, partial [bacterium]|nr:hypothetical protein [bacterium]
MEVKIWEDIINKFNQYKLDYILVGGAALVSHGLPRSTMDIDFYLNTSEKTIIKLFKIADELKLESKQKPLIKLTNTPNLFIGQWLTFSFNGQEILDVFFTDKKEFDQLYKNSETKQDKALSLRVASIKDLIEMKKISG